MEKAERYLKVISYEYDRLEEYVDAIDWTAIEPSKVRLKSLSKTMRLGPFQHIDGAVEYFYPRFLHGFALCIECAGRASDNGSGMSHPFSLRTESAGYISRHGLSHMVPDEFGGFLFLLTSM